MARLRCPWAVGGMVAVPVGGGRARAGLEIDRSEPSGSRVVISRAGRLRVRRDARLRTQRGSDYTP